MSQQEATRQSQRIRSPAYRPRTTWKLPEVVSGVAPTSFSRRERSHQQTVSNSFDHEAPVVPSVDDDQDGDVSHTLANDIPDDRMG